MPKLVRDIGEFGLIKRIAEIIGPASSKTKVGIGDDAATLLPIEKPIVMTTDAMVEGVHFRCDWSTPEEVAHKALASNLSDLAAKAASPLHYVITFGVPFDTNLEWVERFYLQLAKLNKEWNIELIGGDTVKSPQIIISITAWGTQTTQEPINVRGAQSGDWILVTGTLGDSAAGLEILEKQIPQTKDNYFLLERFQAPHPRHIEAFEIIQNVVPTCMTDISDGLARDLAKICQTSNIGAKVVSHNLPISQSLKKYAGEKAPYYAIRGGEDYELLFTLPPQSAKVLMNHWSNQSKTCPITPIGEIVSGKPEIFYEGITEKIEGYDHFHHT